MFVMSGKKPQHFIPLFSHHFAIKPFLCVLLISMLQCTVLQQKYEMCRTVHCKVIVDPNVAANYHWQTALLDLFKNADRVMRSWAHVSLQVDTIGVWAIESAPSYASLLAVDCLVKEVPKGKYDIVAYFCSARNLPNLISGISLYEQGYILVPEPRNCNPGKADDRCFHSLVHWIGHLFGAVHCYFIKDNVTVMNPFIHDGSINMDSKMDDSTNKVLFHHGNSMIMNELSNRPFAETLWNKKMWPPIKRMYNEVKNQYNPWKINWNGVLIDYQNDAFHEGNLLLYLSSWASLCNLPDTALQYIDSLSVLYRAIKKTCTEEGIVGKTKLCSICGFDSSSTSIWLDLQMFYLGIRRSMVFLRKHDFQNADSCFDATMKKMPAQLAQLKDKYINGYYFNKERYGGKPIAMPDSVASPVVK